MPVGPQCVLQDEQKKIESTSQFVFKTAEIITAAEVILSEAPGGEAPFQAQHLTAQAKEQGDSEQVAFCSFIETYCYLGEMCGADEFERFKRTLLNGETCNYPFLWDYENGKL